METQSTKPVLMTLIIMLTILASCSYSVSEKNKTPEKIGVILPLTGQYAAMGEGGRNAMMIHDLRNATVIFEDDACNAKKGMTAAKKLIEMDKVDALITFCTSTSKAAYPLTKGADIPQIALTETYIYENDQLFQMMPPSHTLFEELGKIAGKRHHSVGLFYTLEDVNSGPYGNPSSIRKGVEGSGSNLSLEIAVEPGTNDFKTGILKVIKAKPDVLISVMFKEDHLAFLKQYSEMDAEDEVPLFGDFYYEIDLDSFKGIEGIGHFFNGTISTNFKQQRTIEFVRTYKEKYGSGPPIFSEYGYDAIGMLIETIGAPNLKESLLSDTYDGAQGKIRFNSLGNIDGEIVVKRFNGTEFEEITALS
ncbi:MAG: ABC transporter substrate-binding protein [Nanoarchaeota archaeon]